MLLLELELTDVRSACYTRRNIAFFNLFIILSCNCTNCSEIMAAILDCTVQAAQPMSKRGSMPLETLYAPILYCEDNSYRSKHFAISAVLNILAAILDYGDRIAKTTTRMVLQPLIIHKKWY